MSASEQGASALPARSLLERFRRIREMSAVLCEPLSAEDMVVQAAAHASPAKWHLAHTTWFFETFVLERHEAAFSPFADEFRVLFNSYYKQVGAQHPRPQRGVLTRPDVETVMAYRRAIDQRVCELVESTDECTRGAIGELIELGLHHEQQHQELLLMDVKLLLSMNPLAPAYRSGGGSSAPTRQARPARWVSFDGGMVEVGHSGEGFAYDNEEPRHRRFLEAFELSDRLVTNGEFAAFIDDGGYERAELWLDAGWTCARANGWSCPAYWRREGDAWLEYKLDGLGGLETERPVCHLSFYEANAFARWAEARLPTEFEWERACAGLEIEVNFVEQDHLHPVAAGEEPGIRQAYGDVWEWTRSAYEPYPGYASAPGAIGEYNGKFMCNQQVLRGGCCVTSRSHMRATYRNFFHPDDRWQFGGIRLARSMS
jgi:ergothioneine biosynthesis protein EgtB